VRESIEEEEELEKRKRWGLGREGSGRTGKMSEEKWEIHASSFGRSKSQE